MEKFANFNKLYNVNFDANHLMICCCFTAFTMKL